MSNPITTSGLNGPDISTYHESGQTTREWLESHDKALDTSVPDGDKLTTTWTSAIGPESVSTTRLPDEDDGEFLARHEYEYALAMIGAAPVP